MLFRRGRLQQPLRKLLRKCRDSVGESITMEGFAASCCGGRIPACRLQTRVYSRPVWTPSRLRQTLPPHQQNGVPEPRTASFHARLTEKGNAMPYTMPRRTALFGLAAATSATATTRSARAADTVRVALPTKTYFPTVNTEAAVRQQLFDKEGIVAEPTVYRGGAECLEAMAAGA